MTQEKRVIALLKKNKKRGVSPADFGRGFRLGAVIFDLRERGWDILTDRTRFLPSSMATYILIKAPRGE
jgi:hypothetical protein